jgi:hypothetical protein
MALSPQHPPSAVAERSATYADTATGRAAMAELVSRGKVQIGRPAADTSTVTFTVAPNDPPPNAYAPPAWRSGYRPPVAGRLRPARRRSVGPGVGLAVAVLLALVAVDAVGAVHSTNAERLAATSYLGALDRGDTAAAYAQWCGEDRAVYPEAAFRAQHEYRAGHSGEVHPSTLARMIGVTPPVPYQDAGSAIGKDLALRHSGGRWEVCPRGERLQSDMENCGCMTPAQHLEADVARVVAGPGSDHSLTSVTCPALVALVDGQAVNCTGTDTDGHNWRLIATEANGRTYTSVRIAPAGRTS